MYVCMYVCMYYINVSSEEVVFIAIEFAYFSLTESVQSIIIIIITECSQPAVKAQKYENCSLNSSLRLNFMHLDVSKSIDIDIV